MCFEKEAYARKTSRKFFPAKSGIFEVSTFASFSFAAKIQNHFMSETQPQQPLHAAIFLPTDRQTDPAFHPAKLKIYGLTLLERACRALEKAGIRHITVLANGEAQAMENFVQKRAPWTAEFKVAAGKSLPEELATDQPANWLILSEPFVLDPALPKQLAQQSLENEDATVQAGEGLLFYVPARQVAGFRENQLSESLKLSESSFPLGVSPVRNHEQLNEVKKALRRSLVKPTDGWVSKNLNRPISISISRVLARTSLTPNQFSIFTGLLGILTGWLLAQGGYWGFLLGSFLFHLTSVLDGVDGELARLKFKSSPFGQWLDTMVDNSSFVFALAGFLVGLYGDGVSAYEKIAGLTALGLLTLALTSLFLYLKLWNKGGSLLNVEWTFKDGKTRFDRFMLGLGALGKRDLFALVFFGLGLIGQLQLALIYVCVMTGMMVGFSIPAHVMAARKKS